MESVCLTPQICGGQPLALFYAGVFLYSPTMVGVKFGSQKLKIPAPHCTLKLVGVVFWRNKEVLGVNLWHMHFADSTMGQGYALWQFWSKHCKNLVISAKKSNFFNNFCPENEKIWQVLSRKRQFRALLIEKLV